ncbi:protein of unknown function (plasmid) [Caballeronia sp. S22]
MSCEPVAVVVLVLGLALGLVLLDDPAAFDELAPPPPQADSTREPAPKTSVESTLRRIVLEISERVEAMNDSLE